MTFDNGYEQGDVVRLKFGHPSGGHEGAPFARQDLVVTSARGDELVGYPASVSDKTRGSLFEDDADSDPCNDVRITSHDAIVVRKSAVVMKRKFGRIEDDDTRVVKDPTGEYDVVDRGSDE